MFYSITKRFIDIFASLIALIILFPILAPIFIILLITGEHEVFYFQKRIGYKNSNFYIWKFATMLKDSPNIGSGLHTTRNDPRVLPIGKFLRKSKINELPQLINIIKGDMSLVGPRPLVDKTFTPYPEHVKSTIYNLKPGVTGIGSIVFRDEEKILSNTNLSVQECYSKVIAPYKGELELWYQQNKSILLDFQIIFLTAWIIIFPDSELHYRMFKTLPVRTKELKELS